jgi:hypothetical protein
MMLQDRALLEKRLDLLKSSFQFFAKPSHLPARRVKRQAKIASQVSGDLRCKR